MLQVKFLSATMENVEGQSEKLPFAVKFPFSCKAVSGPSTSLRTTRNGDFAFKAKNGLQRGLPPQSSPSQSTGVCAMDDKSVTNPEDNRQLSLFEPQFDSRIRRETIDGETHFSILDVFQHYGNKANPTQSWKTALKALEKQGFERSTQIVEHQFPGRGQRKTPVATFKTFLRIAQAADIADWEHIRVWMAQVAHERLEEVVNYQRTIKQIEDKRAADVIEYQLSGHSKDWSEARVDSKDSQKNLNSTLYATHIDHTPDYSAIGALQNKELLGMTKREIVDYLGLLPKDEDKYRDRLGEYALDALRQVNRASAAHMKRLGRVLTGDEQRAIIREVIRMVAPTMHNLAAFAGQDFLSGASLDDQGKPLIMRNVKLLKGGK